MENLYEQIWSDLYSYEDLSQGQEVFVQEMLQKWGVDNIYNFLYQGVRNFVPLDFSSIINFISFLYMNQSKIKGREIVELIKCFNKNQFIQNAFDYMIEQKAYGFIYDFFMMLPFLPFDYSEHKIIPLIERYKKENPVMFISLLNLISYYSNDNVEQLYNDFKIENKKIEFIVKFNILGLYTTFTCIQMRKKLYELKQICPFECQDELNKLILANEKLILQIGEDGRPRRIPHVFFDTFPSEVVSDYFIENTMINGDGKSINFEKFLAGYKKR